MRADALSINRSDDLVVTPTMDMMASMGYNFENAYSPVPVVCLLEPLFNEGWTKKRQEELDTKMKCLGTTRIHFLKRSKI